MIIINIKEYTINIINVYENMQEQLKEQRRNRLFRIRKIDKLKGNDDIQINVSRETLEEEIKEIEKELKYCKSAIRSLTRVINLEY